MAFCEGLMAQLDNRRALVTAAAAGIGRATALALAKDGAEVWAVDIDAPGLESLASEHGSIQAVSLDLTDGETIRQFVASTDGFDILVNAVGWVANGSVLDCSRSDLERSWQINVMTMFDTVQAVLPGMLERGHGSVINIASVVSSATAAPNRFAYGTTKAAVIGLTKSIAIEYVTRGIRCNAICPGTVDSPSLRQRLEATGDYEKARADFEARQPMKRLGTTEEVAAMVAFLASDCAGFITGTEQMIDGGWTI